METRKIKPEEHIDALKILSIAFRSSKDFSEAETEPQKFIDGYETCRAAFNDDKKMCSALDLIQYKILFDGSIINMAGIGGVVSLPEERNKGYIKNLFKYCFNEMRENKQYLSFLYPFSNEYYRKFGYEAGIKKIKYTIPINSFKNFKSKGDLRLYIPGTDDSHIRNMYYEFAVKKNLSIMRDDGLWKRHIGEDPYKSNIYTYVWYDSCSKPMGYITFKCQKRQDFGANMLVKDLIWLDWDALSGIFGFIGGFAPNYREFIWETTENYDLSLLFSEPAYVRTETCAAGMSRIVDLLEILRLKEHSEGKGRLVFEVYDDFLEWNNGSFEVVWDSDKVMVEKKKCTPDMRCSIQVMGQLITGYAAPEDFLSNKDLEIIGDKELISKYFVKKPIYFNEYF